MRQETVIVTRILPHHGIGGMQAVAWDMARGLIAAHRAVRVITTSIPGRPEAFEDEGVPVLALSGTAPGRYTHAWWRKSLECVAGRMASVSAVVSVSAGGYGLLKLRSRMPWATFILQAHGTSFGEIASQWRTGKPLAIASSIRSAVRVPRDLWAYPKFDLVVAVGERVHADLVRAPTRWWLTANKVVLINNGIDTNVFYPDDADRRSVRKSLGISSNVPVVISASRLHAQKGLEHSLHAFARVSARLPDAHYLIAGDGPELERLEALADHLGLANQVQFLGALSRSELARTLRAADVFMFLTDRVEGLPLNVLEAMATGLPCVVSRHLVGLPDNCLSRVPQRDPDAVAAGIVDTLRPAPKVHRVSTLPLEFSLSHAMDRYIKLLESSGSSTGHLGMDDDRPTLK